MNFFNPTFGNPGLQLDMKNLSMQQKLAKALQGGQGGGMMMPPGAIPPGIPGVGPGMNPLGGIPGIKF